MDNELVQKFTATFQRLKFALDKKFHKSLWGKTDNLLRDKEELKQETAIRVWIRISRFGIQEGYKLETLFFLSADDALATYMKAKKRSRYSYVIPENHPELSGTFEIFSSLEAIDYMLHLAENMDPIVWEMVAQHANGKTYVQISEEMSIPKTTVVRKITQTRDQIKGNFTSKPSDMK